MTAGGRKHDPNAKVSARALDTVSMAALVYVLLPSLVFIGGWMIPVYAVVAITLLLIHLRLALPWENIQWRSFPPRNYLLLIFVLAAAWTVFGGAGHFFHASEDWQVRDGVYGDLIRGGWPVSYRFENGIHWVLRSAIGYFLVPAALAKVMGLQAADLLLWLWTAIGAALILLLLPVPWRTSWRVLALLMVAIFFSGMDALGVVLTAGYWPIFPIRIEWWVPLSYTSLTGMLYWGPNHALPLVITTALFFRHWRHADFLPFAAVLVLAALIWTPFIVPGLAPFLVLLVIERRRAGATWRSLLKPLLVPMIVAYPVVRFLTLDLMRLTPASTPAIAQGAHAARPFGDFLLHVYAPFVLMEFVILALLLHTRLRHSFALFWISVTVLAVLPFVSVAPAHDILLRFSTPPLIILLALTLVVLQEPWLTWRDSRILLLAVLLMGAVTPFYEIWRGATWRPTPPNYSSCNLIERVFGIMPAHYVGRLNAADVKAMLREPQLSAPGVPSPQRPCPMVDRARPGIS